MRFFRHRKDNLGKKIGGRTVAGLSNFTLEPDDVIAGSLESQLIGLFSLRQFLRDCWQGAFSQYISPMY